MGDLLFTKVLLAAFLITILFFSVDSTLAQEESESSIQMAKMMAEWMDTIWEQEPEEGLANIKILMTKDGEPFAGKVSIMGEFSFRAVGEYTNTTGFNTNSNGRWVYEGLEPGTFDIFIEGTDKFKNWQWSKEGVTVKVGDSPLFEIDLSN
ncbi:MAG: hypothetical protein O6940_01685 [Ignavibacteria bacterium]|nr:hypothetical protein [Ignavibacteria bacterium]